MGYTGIEDQVDFTRARRRAVLRRMRARISGDPGSTRMIPIGDLGNRVVAVQEIVGSVGRSRDSDRAFLPARGGPPRRGGGT